MPGFGPVLAAEFLGATGGDLTVFQSADRFAGVVGLAPAPRDSGRISGNHHRPRRYDRRLLRVFYLSGLSALKSCPASRGYYDRKRVEGKSHIQAMLSLARRRLNVLWAMLRDGTMLSRRVPSWQETKAMQEHLDCEGGTLTQQPMSGFRSN
jgi:transposase